MKIINDPAQFSRSIYLEIAPNQVNMFRFLLEAYDNLALFTVLDKYKAILKVFFSPHQEKEVQRTLRDMQSLVDFHIL